MSYLCGGKQSIVKDLYWLLRYTIQKDKTKCPRCGYNAFLHGFIPNQDEYCTRCGLWDDE